MRVTLKGIHRAPKRLADGSIKIYYYAWKSGPRLRGEPGSPEFHASYNEAVATKVKQPSEQLSTILQKYRDSEEFRGLRDSTKRGYVPLIKRIEKKFSDFPLASLTDRRTRGVFMEWRDKIAVKSGRRQADYAWTVLARILSWADNRGLVLANPCTKGGRLYRGSRIDKIWSDDDEAVFLARAPAHLHLPLMLAIWTGQRQGDLLRLTWKAYDGNKIRLRQSKSIGKGRRRVNVVIPVGAPLKKALDAATRTSPVILLNSDGRPWTSDGFRASWRKACAAAGIVGLTFHDLRGTAVTRLALAECTDIQIAALTGHSLADVHAILDAHYLNRDPALAEGAVRKPKREQSLPTALGCSGVCGLNL